MILEKNQEHSQSVSVSLDSNTNSLSIDSESKSPKEKTASVILEVEDESNPSPVPDIDTIPDYINNIQTDETVRKNKGVKGIAELFLHHNCDHSNDSSSLQSSFDISKSVKIPESRASAPQKKESPPKLKNPILSMSGL